MSRHHLHPFLMLIGLGVAYAALFFLRPDFDLQLERHLYQNGFFLKQEPFIQFSYKSVQWMTRAIVVGTVAILLWQGIKFRRLHRPAFFILLSLALGPGLLVHAVFKDNWGRARPSQIVEFGGTKQFTPPFVITDQCEKNCSFVSGHAAAAFFFSAFALLFAGWKRTIIYSLGIAFGLWMGFTRMAMGGHFFSDIIFAGIFTLLVVHLVYYWIVVKAR
jgi:lipid A 4'-phosphatase